MNDKICKDIKYDSVCGKCSSVAESIMLSKKSTREETLELKRILEKLNRNELLTEGDVDYIESLSEKYLD